jgi:hypothetical protein
MSIVSLVAVLLAAVSPPCGLQPDLADWIAGDASADERSLWELAGEHAHVLNASVIVLGEVSDLQLRNVAGQPQTWIIEFSVHKWIKGCREDDRLEFTMGRGVAGMPPPKVDGTYVFLGREEPGRPGELFGGFPGLVYEIRDGTVLGRGQSVSQFLELLCRQTSPRDPVALFGVSDAVVRGAVVSYARSRHDTGRVIVLVDEVARGDVDVGDAVTVNLPSRVFQPDHVYGVIDSPDFVVGENVVLFLCRSETGKWWPAAGADSKLSEQPDGTYCGYEDLDDLQMAVPRQ